MIIDYEKGDGFGAGLRYVLLVTAIGSAAALVLRAVEVVWWLWIPERDQASWLSQIVFYLPAALLFAAGVEASLALRGYFDKILAGVMVVSFALSDASYWRMVTPGMREFVFGIDLLLFAALNIAIMSGLALGLRTIEVRGWKGGNPTGWRSRRLIRIPANVLGGLVTMGLVVGMYQVFPGARIRNTRERFSTQVARLAEPQVPMTWETREICSVAKYPGGCGSRILYELMTRSQANRVVYYPQVSTR